jgi:hypothetical protein
MPDFFCNGYSCECGTRVRVLHWDKSKPAPPAPESGYRVHWACPKCGRSRWLTWQEILDLPLTWDELTGTLTLVQGRGA